MKAQARLCDLTETMARILQTGRTGEWEFRGPHCQGAAQVLRGGTFEVSPDFRNLVIVARRSDLALDSRWLGRLTIFAPDSDETLYLHCATLITAEPETIPGAPCSGLVSTRGSEGWRGEPVGVLIARVFCVELKVPSHAISVLARSDVPKELPLRSLLSTLGRLGPHGFSRATDEDDPRP